MKLTKEHIGRRVRRVGECPTEGILREIDYDKGRYSLEDDEWWLMDDPEVGTWELVDDELKLREGRRYKRRDGIIIGPLVRYTRDESMFEDPIRHVVYMENARFFTTSENPSPIDLIAEVPDDTANIAEPTRPDWRQPGAYVRLRDGTKAVLVSVTERHPFTGNHVAYPVMGYAQDSIHAMYWDLQGRCLAKQEDPKDIVGRWVDLIEVDSWAIIDRKTRAIVTAYSSEQQAKSAIGGSTAQYAAVHVTGREDVG
jgi:hypothetical protein